MQFAAWFIAVRKKLAEAMGRSSRLSSKQQRPLHIVATLICPGNQTIIETAAAPSWREFALYWKIA
jgi:hypothetical protein